MSMIRRNLNAIRCRKVFDIMGVGCFLTPYAWLSVPFFLLIGILVAVMQSDDRQAGAFLPLGAAYGLILFGSNLLHSIGHILAGKIVGAPNGGLIITSTFHINYHRCDPAVCSRWTHIGRSLGGPLANLTLAAIAMVLHALVGGPWSDFLAKANLIVGIWLLLPLPAIDGWVIWGELFGFRRR